MKKLHSLFAFTLAIIFCFIISVPALAAPNDQAELEESIKSMESWLAEENTDVVTELNHLIAYYENAIAQTTDSVEIDKLNNLIDATNHLIQEYQAYEASKFFRKFHILYTPMVSAAVGVFQKMNFHLAAELLSHSTLNDVAGSYYYPSRANQDRVRKTQTFQTIRSLSQTSGSIDFPHTGGTYDLDCFYALHSVDFYNDWGHKTLEIHDTYDYGPNGGDYNFDDIVGVAVERMYRAQQAGVIVPYEVGISLSF